MYQNINEFLLLPLIKFVLMGVTFSLLIILSYTFKQVDFSVTTCKFIKENTKQRKSFFRIFMGTMNYKWRQKSLKIKINKIYKYSVIFF